MALEEYEVLRCDTCYRVTERKTNPLRPDINKCNITYKCKGSLQLVKKSEKQGLASTDHVAGLQDWKSRFDTQSAQTETIEESNVNLLSGPSHIAIAVKQSVLNPPQFNLIFEEVTNVASIFKEYYFLRGSGTNVISGQDNTAAANTLKFTAEDQIRVYVNGILLTTEYDRSSNDIIRFDPPLAEEKNSIRIAVFKPVLGQEKILTFDKSLCSTESAWSNVKKISIISNGIESDYDVYVCGNVTEVFSNSLLFLKSTPTNIDDHLILLAYEPFSSYDRDAQFVIPLSSVKNNNYQWLASVDEYKNKTMEISESAISEFFPAITIKEKCTTDSSTPLVSNFTPIVKRNEVVN